MKRICLQWPRFGPYHLARLNAVAAYFAPRGVEVVGIETAGRDATYDWRIEADTGAFRRECVFPDKSFDDLSPRVMHAGVMAALERLAPDAMAINSYAFPDARASLEWCVRNGRQSVVLTDSKEDDAPRRAWRERVKRIVVNQFDAALVAGTPQRAYYRKLGFPNERIFIGCDTVDNDYFEQASREAAQRPERYRHLPGLDDPAPFFVSVNRFLPIKNLHGLLDAYRLYRQQAPEPWRLVLVGDGPQMPEIEAAIRNEGIPGVTLAGFKQIDEIPAYYGLAGALIHPTFKDTWGLVVNEAMASGLPVLVSLRAGCARDLVIDNQNGYRFNPNDHAEMARRMLWVSSHPERQAKMREASRTLIAEWSPERYAERLWQAMTVPSRPVHPAYRRLGLAVLQAIRAFAWDVRSFHSVPD